MKLAVGAHDVADVAEWQAERLARDGHLYHLTRNTPRRAKELLDGGSIYWVIAGAMVVRQRIIGVTAGQFEDGSACASIELDPELVGVAGRPTRPFQGWRYLAPEAAPADLQRGAPAQGEEDLPEAMRRALLELGLL